MDLAIYMKLVYPSCYELMMISIKYINMRSFLNTMYDESDDISAILQFVAGSQPINAIAFVLDGLYYGVSDFEYAAYSMVTFIDKAEYEF